MLRGEWVNRYLKEWVRLSPQFGPGELTPALVEHFHTHLDASFVDDPEAAVARVMDWELEGADVRGELYP